MAVTQPTARHEPGAPTHDAPGSLVSPMFARQCNNTSPHPQHNYYKRWHKRLLPYLREADTYPDVWDSPYRCTGVDS